MATWPPIPNDLDPSQWQIQIIVYDQQFRCFQVIVVETVPDRFATLVHESQGAKKNDRVAPEINQGMLCAKSTVFEDRPKRFSPLLNSFLPYIMPGMFELLPRIAEACN